MNNMKKIFIILAIYIIAFNSKAQQFKISDNKGVRLMTQNEINNLNTLIKSDSINNIRQKIIAYKDSLISARRNIIIRRTDSIGKVFDYIKMQMGGTDANLNTFLNQAGMMNAVTAYENNSPTMIINWVNNTYPTLTAYYSVTRKNKLLNILNW